MALAACSGPSSPHVANLGTSDGDTTTSSAESDGSSTSATSVPKGNATQLLGEWTNCMRSQGDPNQSEPTIDANGAIHVTEPAGYFGTIYGASGQSSSGAGITCQAYLTEASTTLNGGEPLQSANLATSDKFAACMRANGVSNFPDPASVRVPPAQAPAVRFRIQTAPSSRRPQSCVRRRPAPRALALEPPSGRARSRSAIPAVGYTRS